MSAPTRPGALGLAAYAGIGAGLVHLAVVHEHLQEWLAAGIFFIFLGAAQVVWGVASFAAGRVLVPRTAVLVSLGTVVLWVVSRTSGLPVGPEAFEPEAVGRADVLSCVLELVTVAGVALGVRRVRTRESSPRRSVAALAAAAALVAVLTTPALAASGSEEGDHMPGMSAEQQP
ncbi:hypothetical protein EV189_0503 [Motilibacter rhizosphaerae]|uniref:Uncharacterized protein n=1 Tax=Motilibacter rhizosphaerae TaxID=598652 RepID=A0A4Q7NVH8_9ACTN|nr:hypothetical protein [Motilibacter rhizosphaerae]RZS91266.1 hypothetical protein EV189_0503 [Motilibacter rhizosphaerae]